MVDPNLWQYSWWKTIGHVPSGCTPQKVIKTHIFFKSTLASKSKQLHCIIDYVQVGSYHVSKCLVLGCQCYPASLALPLPFPVVRSLVPRLRLCEDLRLAAEGQSSEARSGQSMPREEGKIICGFAPFNVGFNMINQ